MSDHLTSALVYIVFLKDSSLAKLFVLDDLGNAYATPESFQYKDLRWYKKPRRIIRVEGGVTVYSKNNKTNLFLSLLPDLKEQYELHVKNQKVYYHTCLNNTLNI